jgi:methylmalonyl-CoA mutase N-terminal domain/subunit
MTMPSPSPTHSADAHTALTAEDIDAGRARWRRRYDADEAAGRVRDADFTTLSGLEVDPVYGPPQGDAPAGFDRIGWPGEYPFTRGLHTTGYRG